MDLAGFIKIPLRQWFGPADIHDDSSLLAEQGTVIQNMEFVDNPGGAGRVQTRRPFRTYSNPGIGNSIKALYGWIQSGYNRLIRLESGTIISRDLNSGTETTVLTGLGLASGAKFLSYGYRLFMAFWSAASANPQSPFAHQLRIWDGTFTSGVPNIESAFPRPLRLTSGPGTVVNVGFGTTGGTGVNSTTIHYFGALVESYGGGFSTPGPLAPGATTLSYTFAPSVTPAPGAIITITFTPTTPWPNNINRLHLLVALESAPDFWYIVPVDPQSVARGTTNPVTFGFNFSDTTIRSQFDPADGRDGTDDYFSLLVQNQDGTGPISPYQIFDYNQRLVMLTQVPGPDLINTVTGIYVSEPSKPQWISNRYHLLTLPQFRTALTGCTIRQGMYIFGPQGTYVWTDNTDKPVTWRTPETISGRIGTRWFRGVTTDSARTYAWVAAENGVYFFNGAGYTDLPSTYNQSSLWGRINRLAGPDSLAVIEDPLNTKMIVIAPLDDSLVPNAMMVWDYSGGKLAGDLSFCGLWPIIVANNSPNEAYTPYCADIVEYQGRQELWLGSSTPNQPILRQLQPQTFYEGDQYYDFSSLDPKKISWKIRVGPMWTPDSSDWRLGALQIWAKGSGEVDVEGFLTGNESLGTLKRLPLSLQPRNAYLREPDWVAPKIFIEISNDTTGAGGWISLAQILSYIAKWHTSFSEG